MPVAIAVIGKNSRPPVRSSSPAPTGISLRYHECDPRRRAWLLAISTSSHLKGISS
jgi:hypothetical protein